MQTEELNPLLLRCSYYNGYQVEGEKKTNLRTVYDYEIEYFIKSDGGVFCNDIFYPTTSGDIIFRTPGTTTYALQPISTYLISLDFYGQLNKVPNYIVGSKAQMHPLINNAILNAIKIFIPAYKTETAAGMIHKIYSSSIYNNESDKLEIKANQLLLINELYRASTCIDDQVVIYNSKIRKIVSYLSKNYTEDIDSTKLIELSGLSKAHFYKLFKECVGLTPIEYTVKCRMDKAKNLLITSSLAIAKIAELCGYLDATYFSYAFKNHTGMSASQFRKEFGH